MRPALALACALVVGCRHPEPTAPPVAAPAASAASMLATAPASTARPVLTASRLTDARWLAARDPDPLEKQRLALAVGTAELLAALEDGGPTADTALACLPFADDGEIALARLAEIARADASRRHRVLASILGIAGQPRRPRDPVEPDGARACAEALIHLASDAAVAREDRALAVSAARALAEHGYIDAGRIPSTLDR